MGARVVITSQALWEGVEGHYWSESQLALFQRELNQFDLLSDHTNAVHRAVLAHVESWLTIPDRKTLTVGGPLSGGGYVSQGKWDWQPRAWRYDNCVQLYQAGQEAIARVNVVARRVSQNQSWNSDLSGLHLKGDANQLLEQGSWWGANPTLVSFAQNAVNQAVIACALERYRLAHGTYPETLDPILPALLGSIPHDIISGRPMTYQGLDKDHYDLRGVGANGISEPGKTPSDDWLWSFPGATNSTPTNANEGK